MTSIPHHNSGILIPRDEYEELTEALATVFRIGSRFTPRLIERLDLIDGDSDSESNGDSEDTAWIEWHTMRGSQKRGPNIMAGHEDDEDDDPSGQCSEDEISCPPNHWTGLAALMNAGPGCTVSDTDFAVDDIACDGDEGV